MATAKKAASKKSAAKKSASAKKSATKKTAARGGAAAKKSAAKKSTARKSGGQRRANAAFMKAMRPSAELAAVVGDRPMPRTEVTKKLWDYIKRNNLQDAKERRMINADDKLRPVFGGKRQVSMFDMTKLVNQHLSEA
jgi:upstream activation factor subunit UAF30